MSLFLAITVWQRIAMPRGGETISKLHTTTWFWLAALTALLLTGCATEPADAQPAAAPSLVVETVAPAEDVHPTVTPEPPGDALAVPADDALPEGPVRLVALDDRRGAEGSVLTPEQLADSASTLAQFTGLEGLTASQPELREGDPDFLARTIVFVNSQGELVGMVVATSETAQIYIWRDANGDILCQPTDQTQPLESEACDAAIAEYWHPTLAAQEQATAEQATEAAEAEQSPHAIVDFQVVSLDAARENNGFLKHNAVQSRLFVNPAMLSEEQVASLDSMVAELQLADDRRVSAVLSIAAQESLAQASDPNQLEWVQALQALLEQKTFLNNAVVIVDQTETGYRLWFTDRAIRGADKLINSYYDTSTNNITAFSYYTDLQPMVAERYPELRQNEWQPFGRIEWSVQTQSMIVRNDFSKLWEYTAEGWRSHRLPHERSAEDEIYTFEQITGLVGNKVCNEIKCPVPFSLLEQREEIINGVRVINLVVPAQDAQGNPIDASQQVVAFTARVDAEGNPLLPLILRYNFKTAGRAPKDGEMMFQPFSQSFSRVSSEQFSRIDQADHGFWERVWITGSVALVAENPGLPDHYASSHAYPEKQRGYNILHINPKSLLSYPDQQAELAWAMTIAEWMEVMGHEYFDSNVLPPTDYFFQLHPDVEQYLRESPHKSSEINLAMWNALLNAKNYVQSLRDRVPSTLYDRLQSRLQYAVDFYENLVKS